MNSRFLITAFLAALAASGTLSAQTTIFPAHGDSENPITSPFTPYAGAVSHNITGSYVAGNTFFPHGAVGSPVTTIYPNATFNSPLNPELTVHPDWAGEIGITTSVSGGNALAGYVNQQKSSDSTPLYPTDGYSSFTSAIGGTIWSNSRISAAALNSHTTITYDFSNLVNGYLPAGSALLLVDFDATHEFGSIGSTSATGAFLNYAWEGIWAEDPDDTVTPPLVQWDAAAKLYSIVGTYFDLSAGGVNDANVSGSLFFTVENLTDLTITLQTTDRKSVV